MRSKTLCYLVLGASLSVLIGNLAQLRIAPARRVAPGRAEGEVVDLAAWKAARAARRAVAV